MKMIIMIMTTHLCYNVDFIINCSIASFYFNTFSVPKMMDEKVSKKIFTTVVVVFEFSKCYTKKTRTLKADLN